MRGQTPDIWIPFGDALSGRYSVTELTVVLHIGAMKTGTSYLQSVMNRNADVLADRGVLWSGDVRSYQRLAVLDLVNSAPAAPQPGGAWTEMTERLLRHPGPTAVVSMEFLSFASDAAVQNAIASLKPARVRVVLGVRDLGRAIPAQWQESTRNRHTWTYGSYLTGLMHYPANETKSGHHFWLRQDWPRILRTWRQYVAEGDLTVMTVPPRGTPAEELWSRFCQAAGIDSTGVDLQGTPNDSLGAASAELMRRLSIEANQRGLSRAEYEPLGTLLGKGVLAHRRGSEPGLVVPEQHRAWVDQRSARLIKDVGEIDPKIVGDLDDLIPRWTIDDLNNTTSTPIKIETDILLDAAIDGLFAFAKQLAAPHDSMD